MQPQVITNYVENAAMSWPIHYQPLSRLATQSEPHLHNQAARSLDNCQPSKET